MEMGQGNSLGSYLKQTKMTFFFFLQEGTGSLQDTKQDLTKIELPHDILSLKQQAQRIEKEY
jgi:hypothetical protein